MSRTTVLVGTFAAICVAHVAAAQTASRPRTAGAVVGLQRPQPPQSGPKPRLAGIAPAPSQERPQGYDRDRYHDGRQSPTVFYVVPPTYPVYNGYANYPAYATYSAYSSTVAYPPPQNVTYVAPTMTNVVYVQSSPTVYAQPSPAAYYAPAATALSAQSPTVFSQSATSYFNLPAIIFNDGRIYANFTGSYEQVLRQCAKNVAPEVVAGTVNPACWTVDSDGRYSIVQGR